MVSIKMPAGSLIETRHRWASRTARAGLLENWIIASS